MIERINHVAIQVSDLGRSEKFYGETLGLKALGRELWAGDPINSAFELPSKQLLILCQVDEVQKDGPGVHTNFMVAAEEYSEIYERLKAAGACPEDHRADQRSVGTLTTYFQDPDGHELQITAHTPDAYDIPAARKGKVRVGRPENFPLRSVTHFPEGKFYLARLKEGFLAISETCTHMQCTVTYQKEHWRFYCPCHYSTFSWTGEHTGHLKGIAPLPIYPIAVEGGELVVNTDELRWRRETSESEFFRVDKQGVKV